MVQLLSNLSNTSFHFGIHKPFGMLFSSSSYTFTPSNLMRQWKKWDVFQRWGCLPSRAITRPFVVTEPSFFKGYYTKKKHPPIELSPFHLTTNPHTNPQHPPKLYSSLTVNSISIPVSPYLQLALEFTRSKTYLLQLPPICYNFHPTWNRSFLTQTRQGWKDQPTQGGWRSICGHHLRFRLASNNWSFNKVEVRTFIFKKIMCVYI